MIRFSVRVVFLLTLFNFPYSTSIIEICPDKCTCHQEAKWDEVPMKQPLENVYVQNCSNLNLHEIPRPVQPRIGVLQLNNNIITKLEIKDFSRKLTVVTANNNKLETVGEFNAQGLVYLHLSNNKLQRIPITSCSVQRLNLEANLIDADPDKNLITYINLEEINMKNNKLNALPEMPSTVTEANFISNQIHFINYFILRNIPNLKTLLLSKNKLYQIYFSEAYYLSQVPTLEIDDNPFKIEPAVKKWCQGKKLDNYICRKANEIRDPPKVDDSDKCKFAKVHCQFLQCSYGLEKEMDHQNCEQCQCKNPCKGFNCPRGQKCVTKTNPDSEESDWLAECRHVLKPEECSPRSKRKCEQCETNADCKNGKKCCSYECKSDCGPDKEGMQPEIITKNKEDHSYKISRNVHVGSYPILACKAKGVPKPRISWKKENPKGQYVILDDGSLQIKGFKKSDAGEFVCVASNNHEPDARLRYYLDVTDKPLVNILSNTTKYYVDNYIELFCDVEGKPEPNIEWSKDGHLLQLSDRISISDKTKITILKATLEDAGTYQCTATNDQGKSDDKLKISILGSPEECGIDSFFGPDSCEVVVNSFFCCVSYYSTDYCCGPCVKKEVK